MKINRRTFIRNCGAMVACPGFLSTHLQGKENREKKRIAFLGTEVRTHSHAQHFLDRLALGYGWQGKWQEPRLDIASIYIDQFPENGDLGRDRVKRYGLKLYPSIEQALTLGTNDLAVDGVVIIAEHGNYPSNDKGQRLYPRYEWFKKCVKVFEKSGRSVPVFNDKHLSTTWGQCKEMVDDSKRLNFPFFAGSSLPVTRRMPSIDVALNTPLKESVCVAYGGADSYDIHALETAQCMSERREGGEVGISEVHALRGERMWERLLTKQHKDTRKLIVSALMRSHNLPVQGGYYTGKITFEWAQKTFPNAWAYFIKHLDGFKTTMLMASIQDFNYAGLRADNDEIISTQMYLPMPTHGSSTADFFHPLCRHIENAVITGKVPYPVERTLLTSGMTLAGVESLHMGQIPVATPHMNVSYKVGKESTYWKG